MGYSALGGRINVSMPRGIQSILELEFIRLIMKDSKFRYLSKRLLKDFCKMVYSDSNSFKKNLIKYLPIIRKKFILNSGSLCFN